MKKIFRRARKRKKEVCEESIEKMEEEVAIGREGERRGGISPPLRAEGEEGGK